MVVSLALLVGCGNEDPARSPREAPPAPGPLPTAPAPLGFTNEEMASVPLLGGTLAPVAALERVIAADPAGDQLVVAGLDDEVTTIALGPNARPFRLLVEEARAYVTLRGTGELAAVDVAQGEVLWRAAVCPEPRGVARSPAGPLVVACAGGELVELTDAGHLARSVLLEPDLRDVVASGYTLYVSRFRAAEVLQVDPDTLEVDDGTAVDPQHGGVAWRMKEDHRGGVTVLYQRANDTVIGRDDTALDDTAEDDTVERSPYGSIEPTPLVCGALHDAAFGRVAPNEAGIPGRALKDVLLPVDWVTLSDGRVVVVNGGAGPTSPEPALVVFDSIDGVTADVACERPEGRIVIPTEGQPAALATIGSTLFVQTANPSALWRLAEGERIELWRGETPADEGFAIFHRDTGASISCASCHPEALDDGRVWRFDDTLAGVAFEGPRKTLPLAGGISQRAPFHWAAELPTEEDLVASTLVDGMGGAALAPEQVSALFAFLDGVRAVRANPGASPDELAAGRAIFEARGCATCHAGEQLADNAVHPVRPLAPATKTPSLVGLGVREVLMHDGCAASIEERLDGDPLCTGGNDHGDLRDLFPEDAELLAKYLRSL